MYECFFLYRGIYRDHWHSRLFLSLVKVKSQQWQTEIWQVTGITKNTRRVRVDYWLMSMSTSLFLAIILSNLLCPITKSAEFNVDDEDKSLEQNDFIFADEYQNNERMKREEKVWGPWETWSPCSVSCGKGQMIKFRHCISDSCGYDEKEARVKPCSMKPCKMIYFKDMAPNLNNVQFWHSIY